ncbi:hypothetical protein HN51_001695 [Arachis hypogaea]|uniref:Drought induced 19 protein type zinc-binding domain-containing protein n=1 Tax=Arachis hypogaea TaxID=3818 RepID=A0A445EQF1_ARAHY|nr:protein DEHYDRATION-INDUCED 19 homolog 5 [Arachis hypogaea]QHO49819.1 uncharacterized protein DS421_1g17290 [Arachis hypogaea]RYR77699.1 hypothetical protein Ahy_A01g002267 [Arachis hypogaea]
MDFDLRSSVHHSAKHLSRVQASRLHSDDYSVFQYTDVDDDPQSHFRCPFCDFAIQVRVLCSNLEEEHCPDLKNVVCPVCDQNLGRDVIRQFTHSNPRKWMWKSEKYNFWSGNSAMLGKKLAAMGNKQESMPDPLLSPFICNMPVPSSNDIHPNEDSSSSKKDLDIPDAKRSGTDAPRIGNEQDLQERKLRADFVQSLVLSTIL